MLFNITNETFLDINNAISPFYVLLLKFIKNNMALFHILPLFEITFTESYTKMIQVNYKYTESVKILNYQSVKLGINKTHSFLQSVILLK